MRTAALIAATLWSGAALAQVSGYAPAPDMSGYARKTDLSGLATTDALSAAISAAQSAQGTKQSAIPAAGPGAGLCLLTVVPSPLVSSGGLAGAAGTCSRIVQCGTSADYVVSQFNVGGGC